MSRRHSWEKLEVHRYRCRRDDCGAVAVKTPDENGPSWSTTWTFPDGRVFSTAAGGRTPPCGPAEQGIGVGLRSTSCGEGVGQGKVCGRTDARLYTRGRRCDDHAPWSPFHGGTGVPPELRGQYCMVPLHKTPTPDSASWAVVDGRAIASGKRRSGEATYRTAQAAVEEQKADRRDAHLSGDT